MPAQFFMRIPEPRDVVEKFLRVISAFYGKTPLREFKVRTSYDEIKLNQQECSKASEVANHAEVKKLLDLLGHQPMIDVTQIEVASAQHNDWPSLIYHNQDVCAQLTIKDESPNARKRFPAALEALQEEFDLTRKPLLLAKEVPKEYRSSLQHYEVALSALTDSTARLGHLLGTQSKELQEEWLRRGKELAEQATQREEEARAQLEEEYSAKHETLVARDHALTEREAALDLREHKAARRESFKQLLNELRGIYLDAASTPEEDKGGPAAQKGSPKSATWTVSDDTLKKRRLIHVLCWAGLVAFGGFAGFAGWKALTVPLTEFHWRLFVPLSTGLVGFASTLIFYLRWANQWFTSHSQREFRNSRLNADIIRANWLAELILEWHEGEGRGDFPGQLLDKLSRNIFMMDNQRAVDHPAAELASAAPRLAQESVATAKKALETVRATTPA